jgi:hypothetical protein
LLRLPTLLALGLFLARSGRDAKEALAVLALHLFPAMFIGDLQDFAAAKIGANDLNEGHTGLREHYRPYPRAA